MSYNSKYKGAEVEGLLDSIGNKVDKVDGKQLSTEDFTTPLKQKLDGLSNYQDEIDIILKQINVETEIKTDTELLNGVYILTEDRQLVSNSTVDPTAIGVVLVTSNQRILIYKHDLHYGDESRFYWGKNLYGKNVAGINDVAFNTLHLDFNGKLNTHAIISAYAEHGVDMDEQDMCTALCAFNSNFNENGGYVDWYIPAAGQLIEIDKNFNAINTALNNINGTKFNTFSTLWSSTEQSENFGFIVDVKGNKTTHSGNKYKNYVNKVRLIRDYAPTKTISIKNKLVELEQSIPTKTSQLENDTPYALKSDVEIDVENGIYAMAKNGELIDYNVADSSCLGVVLVQGVHKFMIAKTDATDGTNNTFSWRNYYNNLLLTDYLRAEGENTDGFLNSADGTPNLSNDYTTWVSGALSDFNGKTNTIAIENISDETSEMGTVLKAFNVSDNFKDWYIPACGQLALIYLNIAEINIALEKIGGTTLIANNYWSSSESNDSNAWCINFDNSYVDSTYKDYLNRIRFIRDIITTKPLKEIMVELESTKQDMIEDLDDIRDGASKGATALQEEQYKGTVTSVTAGEGLAGGTITNSGTISLEKRFANVTDVDLLNKVDILKIGNTVNDTNLTIKDASSVWVEMLSFDKFGRYDGGIGYYKFPKEVTFGEATTSLKGLMSASDKAKLDGIDLTGKQDKLVSGTNIKTINGTSILGSGNINISGGITTPLYPLRVHSMDDDNVSINPGEYHMWPMPMTALTITLAGSSGLYCAHWIFRFSSGSTPTTLSLPNLQWANGNEISISPNKTYEVSITDGLAVWAEF